MKRIFPQKKMHMCKFGVYRVLHWSPSNTVRKPKMQLHALFVPENVLKLILYEKVVCSFVLKFSGTKMSCYTVFDHQLEAIWMQVSPTSADLEILLLTYKKERELKDKD